MAGFLDIFNVVDSDGASATRYRLHYQGSPLSDMGSWFFGFLTELVYVFFQILVVPANALLGTVLDSSRWLSSLGQLYQSLAAPFFAVFPPWALACLGLALVAVSALRERPDAKDAHWGKSFDMGSDTLNRVGGALAMTATVLVLTNNPFALVARLLELANGFSVGLATAVTGSGNDSVLATGQVLVDSAIRTPTIALNYGGEMTAACRTQWSQAMIEGRALEDATGCFAPGANTAGPGTLSTALLMLIFPALPMLIFCGVAAWKYFVHLTLSVACLLATGYVAAVNVHRRRGFDRLTKMFARSVAHLVIAVVVSMLAVALPATVAGLGAQLLSGLGASRAAQPYVLMVSLGVGFAISAWAILQVVAHNGLLVRLFDADASATMVKVFGVDPKKVSPKSKSRMEIVDKWKGERKKDADAKKASALADDPAAATRGARKAAGGESPAPPNRAAAVEQLIPDPDTGSGVAAGVAAGVASAAAAAGVNGAGARVLHLTTSPASTAPAVVSTAGDDAPSASTSAVETAGTAGTDNVGDISAADQTIPPAAGEQAESSPGAPEQGGFLSPLTGTSAASVLADPTRPAAAADPGPPPPVVGLPGADPVLETVARETGRPVEITTRPDPQRPYSPLMRQFLNGPTPPAPAGSVPEVQYGPPLAPIPEATTFRDLQQVTDQGDQPRSNYLRRGFRDGILGASASAGSGRKPDEELAPIPHPGSFQALQVDFLAGDDLECQIEEARAVAGAAGTPVDIEINPEDRRLGLDLSSDPDERIKPSNPPGFGDHDE